MENHLKSHFWLKILIKKLNNLLLKKKLEKDCLLVDMYFIKEELTMLED